MTIFEVKQSFSAPVTAIASVDAPVDAPVLEEDKTSVRLSMDSLQNPDHIIHPLDFAMNMNSSEAMMPSEMYMQHTPSLYSATDFLLLDYDETMSPDQSPHSQMETSIRKASTVTKVKKTSVVNAFVNKNGKLIRGKPCQWKDGCGNRSQSRGLCKLHGGGARCRFSEGCSKSSQGGGYCRLHGGGKACVFSGCNKGQQRNQFCFQHGGNAQEKYHAAAFFVV